MTELWEMTELKPMFLAPGGGAAFSLAGDRMVVKATGAQTGGTLSVFEAWVPPGGGPPPHVHHREEETFYILHGEICFYVGGERYVGGPGAFVFAPRNVPHRFANETDRPAGMLVITTPSGFERLVQEGGVALPSADSDPFPMTPEQIPRLVEVAASCGIEVFGPGE